MTIEWSPTTLLDLPWNLQHCCVLGGKGRSLSSIACWVVKEAQELSRSEDESLKPWVLNIESARTVLCYF